MGKVSRYQRMAMKSGVTFLISYRDSPLNTVSLNTDFAYHGFVKCFHSPLNTVFKSGKKKIYNVFTFLKVNYRGRKVA